MKAIVINDYGAAHVMKLQEIDVPKPGPFEVLVRVHGASINPIDWKIRRGDLKLIMAKRFPRVVGVDFAGVIDQIGSSVKNFKPGDAVFGMANPMRSQYGSYGQYVIAEKDSIAIKPEELSFCDAASIPVAGLTSWKALKQMIALQPGQSVFINGASGGVGTFAVQIARILGASVGATCGAANLEFVKNELGADQVYDYQMLDVRELSDKYDGVFDASAKLSLANAKHLLKKKGSIVTTVPSPETALAVLTSRLLPGPKVHVVLASSGVNLRQELTELADLVTGGKVKLIIAQTIDLADVPAAHQEAEKGHTRGKTVIRVE